MQNAQTLRNQFKLLSRIDKAFLTAFVLRIAYPVANAIAGFDLPGYGLVRFLFIIASIVFLFGSGLKWTRIVLWRVRHRLIVTWILVGVVPIVLIVLLAGEGLYFLMGQVVSYMTANEITRRNESVRSAAYTLAWTLTHRESSAALPVAETFVKETAEAQHAQVGAVVQTSKGTFAVPRQDAIQEIPRWSKPDFVGLIKSEQGYYFGAHIELGNSADKTDVFLYQYAPPDSLQNLLPGVASVRMGATVNMGPTVSMGDGTADTRAGPNLDIPREPRVRPDRNRSNDDLDIVPPAAPPGRGWWDIPVAWIVSTPSTNLASGVTNANSVALVVSRPSLILKNLFRSFASFVIVLIVLTGAFLLIVELFAILFGAKLTRSITLAVSDLYEGTRKVQAGDFSHRIPSRKTKDQLSDLVGSFNNMTERIETLIVEVKEKEKLENELAIARDVQSRLFPKEFPHLKTLEMWGGCQPARTVSGDYYDFVSLGSDRAALAIGDISGKGISAALLMAHIQSALRSQLMLGISNVSKPSESGLTSPSSILTILNDYLYTSSAPEKYATFFLGLYSDEGGQLLYTNAGHLAPLVIRRGQVMKLAGDGFPVGLFPGIHYEQEAFKLEAGDLLVAFTDGVTETPNRNGEEFGDHRLSELLLRHVEKPLDRIANEITTSVEAWAGDVERHDDTTLLLARRI